MLKLVLSLNLRSPLNHNNNKKEDKTTSSNTMSNLLSELSTVVTQILSNIADVCTTIVGQPLLLLTVGFLFIGGVIGIFGRLLSRG